MQVTTVAGQFPGVSAATQAPAVTRAASSAPSGAASGPPPRPADEATRPTARANAGPGIIQRYGPMSVPLLLTSGGGPAAAPAPTAGRAPCRSGCGEGVEEAAVGGEQGGQVAAPRRDRLPRLLVAVPAVRVG